MCKGYPFESTSPKILSWQMGAGSLLVSEASNNPNGVMLCQPRVQQREYNERRETLGSCYRVSSAETKCIAEKRRQTEAEIDRGLMRSRQRSAEMVRPYLDRSNSCILT